MKIKPHQYQHIANGIERIKLAMLSAKHGCFGWYTEVGTFYSNRFKL